MTTGTPATDDSRSTAPGDVEVLHHFVGDDRAAMNDLVTSAERATPGIDITTIEDAQTSMRAKTDILRGSPPDIWDDWPGENIVPYWEADVVADISDLWDEAGFRDTFFDVARNAALVEDSFYALPINLQCQNNLFYNVDVVRSAGIDPTTLDTPDALAEAISRIDAETDSAGLMLPQNHPWPAFDVWDMLVVSHGGPDAYDAIFRGGDAARHRGTIRDALAHLQRYREFVPEDATYDSWQPALERFVRGEAAFYCMGDWAAGVLKDRDGFDYGSDWGRIPFPGTDGVFQVVMDSFMIPTTIEDPAPARAVLEQFGSPESLERFTRRRGALPPRTDVPMDRYDRFFREQMAYYRDASDHVLATRGNGIRPQYRVELIAAMATLLTGQATVETVTDTIVATLSE